MRHIAIAARRTGAARLGRFRSSQAREPEEPQVPDSADATEEEPINRSSRRFKERSDSVSPEMIRDREAHMRRAASAAPDPEVLKAIKALGLGRRKRARDSTRFFKGYPEQETLLGGKGFATFLASASTQWPSFKHMVPEVALAGHSNCGKSSLVNALCGLAPKQGVARVSDRAGWTDAIFFYKVGKKPPVMTLVDLPGYGHAVAGKQQQRAWRAMTKAYVQERPVLSRCCVLVDCLRGLCEADRVFMSTLERSRVPYQVVLTKGDLLEEEALAKSHAVVRSDLEADFPSCNASTLMVSQPMQE